MYVAAGKSISYTPPPNQVQTRPRPLTPTGQAFPGTGTRSAPIERKLGAVVICDELCVLAEPVLAHLQFAGIFAVTRAGTVIPPTFAHTGRSKFALLALLGDLAVPNAAPAPTASATTATAANAPPPLPNRCIFIHSSISRPLRRLGRLTRRRQLDPPVGGILTVRPDAVNCGRPNREGRRFPAAPRSSFTSAGERPGSFGQSLLGARVILDQ